MDIIYLVEEELGLFFTDSLCQSFTDLEFAPRKTCKRAFSSGVVVGHEKDGPVIKFSMLNDAHKQREPLCV